MEHLFDRLAVILKEQNHTISRQIEAAGQQNQALGQLDLPALQQAVDELTALAGQMAQLDEQRELLQADLEQQLDLAPEVSFSALLPLAPQSRQGQLAQLQRQLLASLNELKAINEANDLLTRQAQHFNQTALRVLTSGGGEIYRDSGTIKQDDRCAGVLNKTV